MILANALKIYQSFEPAKKNHDPKIDYLSYAVSLYVEYGSDKIAIVSYLEKKVNRKKYRDHIISIILNSSHERQLTEKFKILNGFGPFAAKAQIALSDAIRLEIMIETNTDLSKYMLSKTGRKLARELVQKFW